MQLTLPETKVHGAAWFSYRVGQVDGSDQTVHVALDNNTGELLTLLHDPSEEMTSEAFQAHVRLQFPDPGKRRKYWTCKTIIAKYQKENSQ